MTTVIKYMLLSLLTLALVVSSGCSEEPIDPKQKALDDRLSLLMNSGKSWVLGSSGSVEKDGYDVSSQFSGFKLKIGNKTYTTQNSLSSAWSSSGTWDFHNASPDQFIREDEVIVTIGESTNGLIITFTSADESSGGRLNSISGNYRFELVGE
jgi:hypothetical protein